MWVSSESRPAKGKRGKERVAGGAERRRSRRSAPPATLSLPRFPLAGDLVFLHLRVQQPTVNPEILRRVAAIAPRLLERLDDHLALDLGDRLRKRDLPLNPVLDV